MGCRGEIADGPPDDTLLALEDALIRLAVKDPVKVELVKLRYFAGLTTQEAAAILGLLTATGPRLSRNRAAPGPGRHLQESRGLAMSSRVPCFPKRTHYGRGQATLSVTGKS